MQWIAVTCNNSRHIVEAQKYLFNKYVGKEPIYIDLEDKEIKDWGKNVASMLPNDDFVIFGLDDFLPIDYIDIRQFYNAFVVFNENELERLDRDWETTTTTN